MTFFVLGVLAALLPFMIVFAVFSWRPHDYPSHTQLAAEIAAYLRDQAQGCLERAADSADAEAAEHLHFVALSLSVKAEQLEELSGARKPERSGNAPQELVI